MYLLQTFSLIAIFFIGFFIGKDLQQEKPIEIHYKMAFEHIFENEDGFGYTIYFTDGDHYVVTENGVDYLVKVVVGD